ncbi:MAG: hypothetical protein JO214_01810 [Frankiaceae bacterium]|nr:hypothetical protein [Frankiaceae bacterium]
MRKFAVRRKFDQSFFLLVEFRQLLPECLVEEGCACLMVGDRRRQLVEHGVHVVLIKIESAVVLLNGLLDLRNR